MLYWKKGNESLNTDDRISLSQFLIQKFHTTTKLAFYSSTGTTSIHCCHTYELKLQRIYCHVISKKMNRYFIHELIISRASAEEEFVILAANWNRQAVLNLLCSAGNPLKALHCSHNHMSLSCNSKLEKDFLCYLSLPELLGHFSKCWQGSSAASSWHCGSSWRCFSFCPVGWYNRLYIHFTLRRHIFFFLLQTYFPATLMVMLSWVSFWIDRRAVPARVPLGRGDLLKDICKAYFLIPFCLYCSCSLLSTVK